MKKIFALMICLVMSFSICLPAFADTLDDNGFNLIDPTSSLFHYVEDNNIYFGGIGLECDNLPDDYVEVGYVLNYCLDVKHSTGAYMRGCSSLHFAVKSSCEYLKGEILGNSIVIKMPDNSPFYFRQTSYFQDKDTLDLIQNTDTTYAGDKQVAPYRNYALFCDLPIHLNDGTVLEPPVDKSNKFELHTFLDDELVWHYSISPKNGLGSLGSNESYQVVWYVVDGSVESGNGIHSTFDGSSGKFYSDITSDEFNWFDTYFNSFTENFIKGYYIGEGLFDGLLDSRYGPTAYEHSYYYTKASTSSFKMPSDFDISIYSPRLFNGTSNISHHQYATTTLNVVDFAANKSNGGVFAYDNIAVIAVIQDGDSKIGLRHSFSVSEVLSQKKNVVTGFEDTESFLPPSDVLGDDGITDISSFARYLKYLFDTLTRNIAIMNNNLALEIRKQIASINWNSLISFNPASDADYILNGFRLMFNEIWIDTDYDLDYLLDGLRGLFTSIEIDTDYDLSSLLSELMPLLKDTQLSLPDLSSALAPAFANVDLTPEGQFANYLGGLNTDLSLHLDSLLGDVNAELGTIKNELTLSTGEITSSLGGIKNQLSASVGELSSEINSNINATFLPDVDLINQRLDESDEKLKSKFKFVSDVQDGMEGVRQSILDSESAPPDFSFTWKGIKLNLIDWSVYTPYRKKIGNMLTAIAYILLIKYIYRTLPGTLGEGDE